MTDAKYKKSAIMRAYLAKIVPGVYQEVIDQTWLNILRFYFKEKSFGLEREAYIDDPAFDKSKANVTVTNVRGGVLHKVLFIEAKVFPRNMRGIWQERYRYWGNHLMQVQSYMFSSREESGHIQTMYGLIAVGDVVRFYQMNVQNNHLGDLIPYFHIALPEIHVSGNVPKTLNIHTDAQLIEKILKQISEDVRLRRNTA